MEDENPTKLPNLDKNMNFFVDITSGIFAQVYRTINENLFKNEYFNILKITKDNLIKEFFIFIRKNQHFFKSIDINGNNIFDFNNLDKSFGENSFEDLEKLNIHIKTIFEENQEKSNTFLCNSKQITSICLNFSIFPKFKKNEINFSFSEDLIDFRLNIPKIEILYLEIIKFLNILSIKKIDTDNMEKIKEKENFIEEIEKWNLIKIEILNLSKDTLSFPQDLYNMLVKELKKIFLNHLINYENFFLSINKFVSHIENFLPSIYNKITQERTINKVKEKELIQWTQEEQEKLEDALKIFREEKDTKIKFNKISLFVKSKSSKECINRYKYIVNLYKKESNKSQNEDFNNNEKNIKIEMTCDVVNNLKNTFVKNQINKNLEENNKSTVVETEKSIFILIKDEKLENKENSKIPKNNEKNTKEKKDDNQEKNQEKVKDKERIDRIENNPQERINTLDTLDLVDQLLNQFEINYINIPQIDNPIVNKTESTYKENSLKNLEEIEHGFNSINEEEIEDDENEMEEDEEIKIFTGSVAKFDKSLNFTYNDQITSNHMSTILNIIKFGEKFSIQYSSFKLYHITLAEITEVNFFIKCKKCKMISFESKFIKISKKINLFYCGTICPKCKCHIQIIFKSEMIHIENLQIAGITYSFGATICDFLTSTFLINCFNCIDFSKKVKFRSGELSTKDRLCLQCKCEMNISTLNLQIVPYSSNNYSFLEDLEIINFRTNTQIVENEDLTEYKKLYEKKIQSGNPLPENGTCKHYHHSYKWFRFDCCCKYFPCDECHNEFSNHKSEWAKLILCGFCCFEQSSTQKICVSCGKFFNKDLAGNGFWEGGKGCRNKDMMSNKDSHKFKNSNNKTISKKKMKENKEK